MHDDQSGLDCRSAIQLLWDYVDGELTPERLSAVERHLTECAHCHPHAEFAERFLAAIHASREQRCCPQATRQRVMEKLREAGMTLN